MSFPVQLLGKALSQKWDTLLVGAVIGAAVLADRNHFDAKLDSIIASSWTVREMSIHDAWSARYNQNNNYPVIQDIVEQSKQSNPHIRDINRIAITP